VPKASGFWEALLVAFGLAALTVLAFLPLLGADFINYDDPMFVTGNPMVQDGVTWRGLEWAASTLHMGFYYPLTLLSHMLDCQIYGQWAGGHHLTSILIHLASTLILLTVLRRTTGALWPSALVAALFALHPLHVESVAWIAERKDVLSTFFLMLTLLAYVGYTKRPSPGRYAVVAAPFLCALLSKAMTVTAPLLLLLIDYWPLGRLGLEGGAALEGPGSRKGNNRPPSWWRPLAEKVPLFLLSMGFVAITLHAQQGAITSLQRVSLGLRCQNALISYAGYLAKLLVPANLAIFYPFHIQAVTMARAALATLLLLLITTLAWRFRRHYPYLLMGWLWYLSALIPVIGILQVGSQSSADRYTYVPSIGIFIMLAWSASEIRLRGLIAKRATVAAVAVVIAALGAATWAQTCVWHDSVTLFRHTVKVTRDNYLAHTMLGMALQKEGDLRGAADQLKEAVRLAPDYVDAWGDLGNLFRKLGKLDAAAACFQRVMVLSPRDDRACMNLGLVREAQGRLDEAERCYAEVWTRNPSEIRYGIQQGRIQAQRGHDQDARRSFERAAALDPRSGKPFYYMGLLDLRAGQIPRAEANLRKAAALEPAEEMAPLKLGLLLEGQGRLGEAEAEYREALERNPKRGEAWLGLARIAAAGGRPEEARQYEARGRALLGKPSDSPPGVSPR
jgi:protein O-mannosyl-transferase